MTQHISLTAAHWVYLAGVVAVVLTMILRANVVVPSIVATFVVALAWTASPVGALWQHLQCELRRGQGALQHLPGDRADHRAPERAENAALRRADGAAVSRGDDQRAHRLLHPRRHHLCDLAVLLADAGGSAGFRGAAAGRDRRRPVAAGRRHGDCDRRTGHGPVVGLCDRRRARHQRQGGGRGRQCRRRRRSRAGAIADHRRRRAGARLFLDPQADQARQRGAARAMAEAVQQW